MKWIALTIFALVFNLGSSSQNCSVKRINSYADTLAILMDYSGYLFSDAKPGLKNKLITFYADGEVMDTCYLFLIPESQNEFISDGDYISQFVHQPTINKQQNVRWVEVSKLVVNDNYYLFAININKSIRGTTKTLKTINYKVTCKPQGRGHQFLRKW